jgi:hypothetical protein
LVALSALAMAQVKMESNIAANLDDVQKVRATDKEAMVPVWEVTFDEETPVWTFGSTTGTKTWAVSDTTPTYGWLNTLGTEVPPMWWYMGRRYVKDFSDSGNKFAWIDGISDLLEIFPQQVSDSYIQFDNIDLSAVANPKISFFQNYKALNVAPVYLDFSTDGGTTWESVEINTDVSGNSFGESTYEFIATNYIANQANVSMRFRWTTSTDAIGGYGYGWEIDDIRIFDNPDIDMKLVQARMNFYEYVDYTVAADAQYYHYSSHYGNIPSIQYDSDLALSWFNVCVENKGNLENVPQVNVKVFDPEMTEIFTNTVPGLSLLVTGKDTVDLIELDFALGASPMIGKYTVAYSVAVEGQTDANPGDNTDTTYFVINDNNYFGHDIDSTNSYVGPSNYVDGGLDGDMLGTTFTFLFQDIITSMDVFINENTSVGTSIIGHVMQYDAVASTWVDLSTSSLITISEADLGKWMNLSFADQVNVTFGADETAKSIMAAIEFYYNGDNDIYIGYDPYVPVSIWSASWFFKTGTNANTWIATGWEKGGLNIHLNLNGFDMYETVGNVVSENINIYPNPTNGSLNIENVKGADLQVVNMMGQVVETVINANEFNTIDMSAYANGTYFVKIIANNQVVTRKINLMK